MNFIFYDTETTGTQTAFDQILQFAAICTDENFNEIERLEVRSRLLPHIVPAPGAVRVNGVSVAKLLDQNLPSHYGMVRLIESKLRSWSPAVFIGYNSIRFDENILRQALYQTLHQPYVTNTGGSCRTDALTMVRAASLFVPNSIAVPLNIETGAQVFKLDQLAPLNGFEHHNAHDALGVEATIHMCRLVKERAPEIWACCMRFSRKSAVHAYLTQEPIICLAEFYGGKPYTWLVTYLGSNSENGSELCMFDLSLDPAALNALNDEDLHAELHKSPKSLRWVRTNSCPILMPANKAPSTTKGVELDPSLLSARVIYLREHRALREKLIRAAIEDRPEYGQSTYVEQQIYNAFFSNEDQELMRQFHESPWEARFPIIAQFQDPRLRTIGARLIYFEKPEVLSEEERRIFEQEFASRLLSEDEQDWLTLHKAIEETDAMLLDIEDTSKTFLSEYRAFLTDRLNGAKKFDDRATARCNNMYVRRYIVRMRC